jgi:hypothetical protein
VYDEVKKYDIDEVENVLKFLFFSMIYPNSLLETPFDIVF